MKPYLLLLGLLVSSAPAVRAADGPQSLQCITGPVQKTYGGTPWLIYSCGDGQSLVIVSAPGSPAAPFYFILRPKAGQYELSSEGTGAKAMTGAALAEIRKLSPADIAGLIRETRQIKPPPAASADPMRARLIGHWSYVDKAGANDLYLGDDGSFSGTIRQDGKVVWSYGGNWTLESGRIVYSYTFSNPHPEKVGLMDVDQVRDVTADCFTLISATTDVVRACRVP